MAENRDTTTSSTRPGAEMPLRVFRERMAAFLAIMIVASGFIMTGLTLFFVSDAEQFGRAKDLLLIINPWLGVAIGYFFNKVTSDARAEVAEKAVDVATATAQQATQERAEAVVQVEAMRDETTDMKAALEDLTACGNEMLSQPEGGTPTPGTLGLRGDDQASPQAGNPLRARMDLEASIRRAQKLLG